MNDSGTIAHRQRTRGAAQPARTFPVKATVYVRQTPRRAHVSLCVRIAPARAVSRGPGAASPPAAFTEPTAAYATGIPRTSSLPGRAGTGPSGPRRDGTSDGPREHRHAPPVRAQRSTTTRSPQQVTRSTRSQHPPTTHRSGAPDTPEHFDKAAGAGKPTARSEAIRRAIEKTRQKQQDQKDRDGPDKGFDRSR